MAGKRDWLREGISILTEEGSQALTIDRLCGRLGLTKGSFYHHFAGMTGYKAALLEHYERIGTQRFIEAVEADPVEPVVMLDRLLDLVMASTELGLDTAMRAWAQQDPQAGEMMARVDQARVEYMESLWLRHRGDAAEARMVGQLLYAVHVGARHMLPPLQRHELGGVYRLLLDRLKGWTGP
ncbi:DNA-binding transcriptional regulator, AcrR family [Actinokineospora alba]|uniref:DNA-binding transcriptional regulator, AcrR family n=1 Tax=Actinokineospora alba TaxID=504798 RepID=A0A1H0TZG4_9PSEU|nr:TetR/AcrR family transcriptional regulator [Actinokineospora alba]TDP70812.1 TetR family transcriptional regulator [Actinokineospora alba]SDJ17133.1 DNA-binding transcriptional regulator, AcrR family [Actinokineospora alba]SDP59333.1 DNA-binding transcriptional regulator, AcrR family [Actinokineospora alba]